MNDEKRQASGGGLGLGSVLGIVFIVLKLCGVIKWSWFWVLSPFWISIAIVIACLLFTLICSGILWLIERKEQNE